MNYTLIIVCLLLILKLIGGYKRGMTREISGFLALIVTFVAFSVIVMLFSSFQNGETVNTIYSVIILTILGVVYGLVRLILNSAKAISHLPVFHMLDRLLGSVVGMLKVVLFTWIVFSLSINHYLGSAGTLIQNDIQNSVILQTLLQYNFLIK